jgi:hypothetical protein
MANNSRIKPYIDTDTVILFERLREQQKISMGKLLELFLNESESFKILLDNHYNKCDEELSNEFLDLHPELRKNYTTKINA